MFENMFLPVFGHFCPFFTFLPPLHPINFYDSCSKTGVFPSFANRLFPFQLYHLEVFYLFAVYGES